MKFPLDNPSPDFDHFKEVIKGISKPDKVNIFELLIDAEIQQSIVENVLEEKWIPPLYGLFNPVEANSSFDEEAYLKQRVNLFYKMGYVTVPDMEPIARFHGLLSPTRQTDDTALLSKGKRVWAEEGSGMIRNWEDYEKFPWKKIEGIPSSLEKHYALFSDILPEGMKLTVSFSLFEQVLEWLLGYEGLFFLLHDDPDLVKSVVDRFGEEVLSFYKSVVSIDSVGVIFHADDLGFKTSTMLSPTFLKKLFFPWYKKYSDLAHQHDKLFFFHSCGNIYGSIDDFIHDIKIDALHSFQDEVLPLPKFMETYGNQIAGLGGVDIDKLCRYEEKQLREYIRDIINGCMPYGRFALGSGNSVCNYIPFKNYLIMVEEALSWTP